MEKLPTTCTWIAVRTVVCASGEPLGSTTCGVTKRRLLGVKVTAAAATAGDVGEVPVPATGLCSNDRLNGLLPAVVSVSPRTGAASAGPASAPARKMAGSR